MALPKIDLPRYKHELLGLGKKITYRPFTLKEQKILLLAKQSEDTDQIVESIKQIIELCTDSTINVDELAFFDIEDLFLRIRSKSVGEISELMYRDKETDKQYKVNIRLDDVRVTVPEGHTNKIMLTDEVGIVMKYPTLEMLKEKDNFSDEALIKLCIDYIFDSNEMYYPKDFSDSELDAWIEELDSKALLGIQKFFDTMPRLRYEMELKLENGRTETLKFEGIESFFT